MTHEVIIIGSGPAGLTSGIYLGRFKRNPVLIDGNLPGGQLMTTGSVENWPGEISIDGPVLMQKIIDHAKSCGCEIISDSVIEVDFSKSPLVVNTKHSGKFLTKSIIIATGSSPRRLGCTGENEYWGRGVNVCATCDAPLYKDREVVVVGGGNSAIAESFALSKYAKKVTLVQLHEKLTATDPLTDKVLEQSNVNVIYNRKVIEILGDGEKVTGVTLEDVVSRENSEFSTQGVFIAIGMVPNSKVFAQAIDLDDRGYVIRDNGCKTSVEGVFVAGDVADARYRQAITASGQGCSAALQCEEFLRKR